MGNKDWFLRKKDKHRKNNTGLRNAHFAALKGCTTLAGELEPSLQYLLEPAERASCIFNAGHDWHDMRCAGMGMEISSLTAMMKRMPQLSRGAAA
jgi:hypothetical protein